MDDMSNFKAPRSRSERVLDDVVQLRRENSHLRAALESISKNSCCDACQEAKRVAIAALEGRGIPETLSPNPITPPKAQSPQCDHIWNWDEAARCYWCPICTPTPKAEE